jgi:hypothetical protein
MIFKKIFLAFVCLVMLSSCKDAAVGQDQQFIAKIKKQLKQEGDVVKVIDVHPGNWEKVCFTSGDGSGDDALDAVSRFTGINKKQLEVINRDRSDTRWVEDFEWGIYFFYSPNIVEYFSISNKSMARGGAYPADAFACVSNKEAQFLAHTEHQIDKDRKNYFRLSLTTEKGER